MDTNTTPRCHTCLFWTGNRQHSEGQGECHRRPPQVAGLVPQQTMGGVQTHAVSCFPTISGLAWCGEWHFYNEGVTQ